VNQRPEPDKEDDSEVVTFQRKLEFHRSKGTNSRLENSHVIISFMLSDPRLKSVPVAHGLVIEVSKQPTNIVVKVSEPLPVCIERSIKSGIGHWELCCIGNVTSYIRGIKALSLLTKTNPQATNLTSILVHPDGAVRSSATSCLHRVQEYHSSAAETYEGEDPKLLSLNPLHDCRQAIDLNPKQMEAVKASLSRSLTLIHGPPGTGKTRVACEIVCHYLARGAADQLAKVLVAAETNMAVDNVARQLMHQQVHVVRVGNKAQISDDIYPQISLESLVARVSGTKSNYIDRRIASKILQDADVVAATCVGAGDGILKGFNFPFVIIDEATQVKEPASLVAITKKCQQLTLIGDPEQLAPFKSPSRSGGHDSAPYVEELTTTLFHRLQSVVPSVVLEVQYRMSSGLVKFPSVKFYGGKLVCSPSITERQPNFELRSGNSIDFIDVVASEEIHVGSSFKNEKEADVIVDVVKFLLDSSVSPYEMTILTPYKKQVQRSSQEVSVKLK
jgi:superfamily I DNA and/or RNA helicase